MQTTMKRMNRSQFLAMADESIHGRLQELMNDTTTRALVRFENLDMSSSQFGRSTVLVIGFRRTYRDLSEVEGKYLGDLPSERQYPVAYWRPDRALLEELREEAEEAAQSVRGHSLEWEDYSDVKACGTCWHCGAWVQIEVYPAPNSIDIGGPAVATNCGCWEGGN